MRTIGAIAVALNGKTADFQRKFAVAEKTLVRFENRTKLMGQQMTKLGRTMMMGVTLPLAALAAMSVKAFAGFDKAMIESTAIMGNLSLEMQADLKATAKQLSTESTFAAKDLAKGYFYLASAGMSAEQSIVALRPATRFAQAGAFDLALAVDLLTDAQSALGLTSKNTEENIRGMIRVSDVLVKANTMANATVQQFSESLTRQAGPAMKALGMEIEEGVAVLAAFADQGIKAELAGGYLARTLRLLTQGAVKHEKAYKKLGIRVFDSQGKLRNVADVVEDLTRELTPMSDKLRTITFEQIGFAARTRMAIEPLLGLSEKIREYESGLRDAAGITDEVANKQLKSFIAQITILWHKIQLIGMELGEKLIPIIEDFMAWVEKLVKQFGQLSAQQKKSIIKWGAILAAIGPVLLVVGGLIKGIGLLSAAFRILILKSLVPVVIRLTAVKAGLDAVTVSAGITKVALVALQTAGVLLLALGIGAALGTWARQLESVANFSDKAAEGFMQMTGSFVEQDQALITNQKKWAKLRDENSKKLEDEAKLRMAIEKGNAVRDQEKIRRMAKETVTAELLMGAQEERAANLKKLQKIRAEEKFGSLSIENKLIVLAEQRLELEKKIAKASSIIAEELGSKIDTIDFQMKSLREETEAILAKEVKSKKKTLAEEIEGSAVAAPRYATAIEKGTVEAYRAELGQQKIMNKVEKNTSETADSTEKSARIQEDLKNYLMQHLVTEVVQI